MKIGAMNHPGRSFEEEVRWIGEAGLDFLDLTLEPPRASLDQLKAPEVVSLLHRYNLGVVGHTAYYLPIAHPYKSISRSSVDEIRRAIDFFAAIGARLVNVHPHGYAPHHPRTFIVERNLGAITELIEHARSAGIVIMVENVPQYFNTADQLAELLDPLPELGLHLDIGHSCIQTSANNTERIIERFGSRIRHVHLHDNKNDLDLHLPLGVGTIQWQSITTRLWEIGYNETITLEVFAEDRRYLTHSREVFRAHWDSLG